MLRLGRQGIIPLLCSAQVDYAKPPLVEIYAEFFLAKGTLPAENLFDTAAKVKASGLPKIEISQQFDIDLAQSPQPTALVPTPKIKCWSEDRTRLVQVAPDLIAVNLVSPESSYPGWEDFRAFIQKIVDATISTFPSSGMKSVSLNTIDKFLFPRKDFVLAKYFNVGGSVVPAWYRDAREACDIDMGWGLLEKDGFNRQMHIKVRPSIETAEIYVNSTFHVSCATRDLISGVLESLHDQSRTSFEGLLTDVTRKEVMGGHK